MGIFGKNARALEAARKEQERRDAATEVLL